MKETDLSSLEKGFETTVAEYSNIPIPDDYSKLQACQLMARELKMISDEKRRVFEEKMQTERFELEKDHKYWSEKFDEKKFKDESDASKERLKLDEKRLDSQNNFESIRLDIEKTRLDLEKSNFDFNVQCRKEDQKFKWISLGLSIGVPFLTTLISLVVYKKLAYANLKLIYVDEGRPTNDFKDAVKNVKNLIK